jgi:hypothetical protein
LTATISALLKLPVLAPSLNDASRCSEADGDDVLKGFTEEEYLSHGRRKNGGQWFAYRRIPIKIWNYMGE